MHMLRRIPAKTWISIVTFVMVAIIVYFSRHELVAAWNLLGSVNMWILLLIFPIQAISYRNFFYQPARYVLGLYRVAQCQQPLLEQWCLAISKKNTTSTCRELRQPKWR